MKPTVCQFGGWERNLRFANEIAEIIVTLDVGPRIISYRLLDRGNVLKVFKEELGKTGEDEWVLRGGHRIWIAPEVKVITNTLDNGPVATREEADGSVAFLDQVETPIRVAKELTVKMDDHSSKVEIGHLLTNRGDSPLPIASWGITALAEGGTGFFPLPPLGCSETDLQPASSLVFWPYTELDDSRLALGKRFVRLRHDNAAPPLKIGIAGSVSWGAYAIGCSLFVKTFSHCPSAAYTDMGASLQLYTDQTLLELETLSPQQALLPGQSVSHSETWHLFPLDQPLFPKTEPELERAIAPFLEKIL